MEIIKGYGIGNNQFKPCKVADFTVLNQGSRVVYNECNGVIVYGTYSGEAMLLVKAIPTQPYCCTMYVQNYGSLTNNSIYYGMCVRDSVTGNWEALEYICDALFADLYVVRDWANTYTGGGSQPSYGYNIYNPNWFRITDDNTNRKYWLSRDGVNWVQFYSTSRTSFCTPNQIGFMAGYNTTSTLGIHSFNINYSS